MTISRKLEWQEVVNDTELNCSVDIAIHPSNSKIILLTIPGVDGSVDGYKNKYLHIAEQINKKHNVAAVRMSNPFITSFLWEQNTRKVLRFIENNSKSIAGSNNIELRIMAHSAGASVISQIAWEYPFISKLLLVNPATKLDLVKIKQGLLEFGVKNTTILVGDDDPSLADIQLLKVDSAFQSLTPIVIEGADHHFSGKAYKIFIEAPGVHLFNKKTCPKH